jgi:hypothetical protein
VNIISEFFSILAVIFARQRSTTQHIIVDLSLVHFIPSFSYLLCISKSLNHTFWRCISDSATFGLIACQSHVKDTKERSLSSCSSPVVFSLVFAGIITAHTTGELLQITQCVDPSFPSRTKSNSIFVYLSNRKNSSVYQFVGHSLCFQEHTPNCFLICKLFPMLGSLFGT